MTPERWQQVKEVFQSAIERPPSERDGFISQACADDPDLRSQVQSLISSYDEADGSFESVAVNLAAQMMFDNEAKSPLGQCIGPYEITALIGRGGMGEVYLARDSRLSRMVALKLLPSQITQDKQRLERFKQEARAASALNHPNILTIHEIGESEGRPFIATEFIEGETLRSRIENSRVGASQALDVAIQIASGLNAAHEAGIIHRDIKPENIMLRRDGYVKILDFGLAKLIERQAAGPEVSTLVKTEEGVIMGTARYMSPEQARGSTVDARTDIWSLGVVLYEMVAGRAPFAGATTTDLILSIIEREPAPLARYAGELPAELQRIATKALAKDREKRYQTVKDLLIDLKNLRDELDFEAKLERSAPPQFSSEAGPQSQQSAVAAPTGPVGRSTMSAEYLISAIKQHKRVAALALAALAVAVAGATYFYSLRSGGATINSMAVLPFANAGADPDTEYLSDGITESLINSLSQLPNLRMIARTSAQRYKGREADPQTVARELGVQALLTGRVVRRGDSLSVSAELVDARDNRHIWGEQFNRRLSDILAVQQEIAREIGEKLRARLAGDERRRVTRNYTENVEAYQLYLRGRYLWNRRTRDSSRQAIEYFKQAIDLDANYALAYSGLADCYSHLAGFAITPSSERQPAARAAVLRALEIDDSLAEAHASLGFIYTRSWQWAEAERELKLAIQLNPNYASAHQWYGEWLLFMGRPDEALAEHRRALELDPLSEDLHQNLARYFLRRGELDAAINECRKIMELHPNSRGAYFVLAHVYQKQGRHEEAIEAMQKNAGGSGRGANLGYVYAVAGRRSEALAIVRELEDRYARREVSGAQIAFVYAGLGDKDQVFAWLERLFQERSGGLPGTLRFYPFFDTLRDDPRFADLLRRMGLPY